MRPAFRFSRKERRALAWIVFFIILMRVGLAFRPESQIYTRPLSEDSFYLFSCAEHFAQGQGFTVDGSHPTNGVQPLIVVLYAPLFYLADFDKVNVLRFSFGYAALFDAITAILLALLVRSVIRASSYVYSNTTFRSPPVLAAILWGFLYPVYLYTTDGLETALYAMCFVGSLLLYAELHRIRRSGETPSFNRWLVLGLVLGITVLARVDAVMLVAAICIVEVIRYREKGIWHAIVIGIIAIFISSPWWLYNYGIFGSLMPQSGMAESLSDELVRNSWMAVTIIADAASVFFFLPKVIEVSHIISVVWVIVVLAGLWFVNRKIGLLRILKANVHFFMLSPLILVCLGFAVYYVFFFSAPHFIARYFQPFRILGVVLAAVALPYVFEHVRHSRSAKRLVFIFFLIAGLFSFIRYGYAYVIEEVGDFYLVGKWAQTVPEARIGMDQSGTAGYIAPNVTNLDGKVNFDALQAKMHNDIGAYLEREKFDYLADWQEFVHTLTSSVLDRGLIYVPVDTIGRVHIYKLLK